MRNMRYLTGTLLAILCSVPVHSTTVIVVARNGQIYIGADSKRSQFLESGASIETGKTACKIQQHGAVLVSHSGGALFLDKNTGDTVFDAAEIARKAVASPGSLSDKADSLERSYWAVYRNMIKRISTMDSLQDRVMFKQMLYQTTFVVAGIGKDGLPEAIRLDFFTNFNESNPSPQKYRMSIPKDAGATSLGWDELIPRGAKDPFAGNINQAIVGYLKQEAGAHSSQVGPPYSLARVTKDGIVFDQKGACGQSQNHAQIKR
jgi:hypothetical protein